jgi:hypothetical protein
MKFGCLSEIFSSFAWKRITAVEVLPSASHGHEFNSSSRLREILGGNARKTKDGQGIPAKFVYLSDSDDTTLNDEGFLSWYDSRQNQEERSAEWRLYYTDNDVIGGGGRAGIDDSLVIAFSKDISTATVLIAKAGSTSESQLLWLFGVTETAPLKFETADIPGGQDIDLTRVSILEAAGVEIPATDDALLDRMLKLFGGAFPTSAKFSEFIRTELTDTRAQDGADHAVLDWMECEEFAFRVLERALVRDKIKSGFHSVDEFIALSLSVQNRRKARAGRALENHLGEVFKVHDLTFAKGPTLENKARPDFLFPGRDQYFDATFPVALLTLLGAKTTCKDRWRQVLAEGKRLENRHLVTLEPAISSNQLSEMRFNQLQLVVPAGIQSTYAVNERHHLQTISDFIALVKERQIQSAK